MNDYSIRDMCRELASYDWDKLADRLCRLNQRDRAGTTYPDGFKARTISGDIPANDPEAMTPVERAADLRAFGTPEKDEVHLANVHALSALSQAHLAAGSLIDHVRRGEEVQRLDKPIGQTATPCKVGECDSPAVKNGFCDTDNRFNLRHLAEHNEPAPMGVLEENARNRKPGKKQRTSA
jgi:hypothetical protein